MEAAEGHIRENARAMQREADGGDEERAAEHAEAVLLWTAERAALVEAAKVAFFDGELKAAAGDQEKTASVMAELRNTVEHVGKKGQKSAGHEFLEMLDPATGATLHGDEAIARRLRELVGEKFEHDCGDEKFSVDAEEARRRWREVMGTEVARQRERAATTARRLGRRTADDWRGWAAALDDGGEAAEDEKLAYGDSVVTAA